MNWAAKRRTLIEIILLACGGGIIAIVLVATFYKTPSCMDTKQNQGELGIDCGGPCAYACTVDETPPAARFVRAVSSEPGRTDAIAYIDNTNADAGALNASYTIEFYGPTEALIGRKTGTINVPPSTTVPLFLSNLYSGSEPVSQAFLTFDQTSLKWLRAAQKPIVPVPDAIQIQDGPTPRITARLTNPTAHILYNISVVATVFDASDNAIAASQTLVPQLPSQGSAPLIFTWNAPFAGTPARVEILPAAPSTL
ncbi:hypothetical protein H0X32_02550 [Patescibacteria group bacterium]|nr:hypothetical protein [Patescibacteria group bacterium]